MRVGVLTLRLEVARRALDDPKPREALNEPDTLSVAHRGDLERSGVRGA